MYFFYKMSYNIFMWFSSLKIHNGGAAMKKFLPDKNACGYIMMTVVVFAALAVFAIRLFVPSITRWTIAILSIIAAFLDFVYIPLYFRNLRYEADDVSITKHSGVFLKSTRAAELSAVRYTTMITTPFSEYTGFNAAVLFMYGGQLRLLFLSRSDISELVDLAKSAGGKGI